MGVDQDISEYGSNACLRTNAGQGHQLLVDKVQRQLINRVGKLTELELRRKTVSEERNAKR